ncbi:HAD-IB family hydrolase [Pandoraea apista]|uniref:HAD family hydrolase n=1 Tax=Pandoraea apista TaxID=93218 RepID=A0A0G4JLM1_9BURK|nr:HAD-IB family hydrolase [Pandoraea apista]ALS64466.1 HAD family hydrolase [Pandoraea apista]AVF41052.1 HAD-IB family hydrolase [Pandoraea apista]OXS88670.1 HAD family hydrolase [Pandoraea apista]PTD99518.1 HAD-IB family hydrolase [Pandoraea apista]RRJ32399.1 HAD-IB family hydrolase [Pandoraea apista]
MRDTSIIAAFDFDGTISTTDSLRVFVRRTVGTPRFLTGAMLASPWLLGAALRLVDRGTAKAAFLRATIGGRTQGQLEDDAQRFVAGPLQHLLRPEMLARLRQHRALGHRVVLVSASPGLYLRPWANAVGVFDAVLSTELAFDPQGRFAGQFAQPNCWGPEKVRRLEAWWTHAPPRILFAYGDSRGDKEMAARADHAWIRGQGTLMPLIDTDTPERAS